MNDVRSHFQAARAGFEKVLFCDRPSTAAADFGLAVGLYDSGCTSKTSDIYI
jgi:hypothetical protein